MKPIALLLGLFFFQHFSYTQTITLEQLINKTKSTYVLKPSTCKLFNVVLKSKNYLDTQFRIDTGIYTIQKNNSFILKEENIKRIRAVIYTPKEAFHINKERQTILKNVTKYNNLAERFSYFPFFNDKSFYNELLQAIEVNYKNKFTPTSLNVFTVNIQDALCKITIDSTGFIHALTISRYSKKYGLDIKEYLFKLISDSCDTALEDELKHYQTTFQPTNFKKIEKENSFELVSNELPNIDTLLTLLNIKQDNYQFIYLDFFYRTCLPCIKAIPITNKINQLKEVLVYGIDPMEADQGNWDDFIKRYNIEYRIVDFPIAERVRSLLAGEKYFGYPTGFLIDIKQKKIVLHHDGYDKKLYKKVLKIIGNNSTAD